MLVKEWMRKIPHPYYGNYGGRGNNKDGLEPIDALDYCFMYHDCELAFAQNISERKQADARLVQRIHKLRFMDIGLTYGRLYATVALKVFGG